MQYNLIVAVLQALGHMPLPDKPDRRGNRGDDAVDGMEHRGGSDEQRQVAEILALEVSLRYDTSGRVHDYGNSRLLTFHNGLLDVIREAMYRSCR